MRAILVVPCFDEADRLDGDAFRRFSEGHPDVGFELVDDGSRDDTVRCLRELAGRLGSVAAVLERSRNGGKAEAVRSGLLRALARKPTFVGYWDADLAAPLEELDSFLDVLEREPGVDWVLGSRVALLGHRIERSALRHYVGRLFATAASQTLGLSVYDTQCGAKLFRASAELGEMLEAPFLAGWSFDVELLARWLSRRPRADRARDAARAIRELPLREWRDVAGSRVRPLDALRAGRDLWRIHHRYLR